MARTRGQLVERELIVLHGPPDPLCLEHTASILQHTLLRATARTRGCVDSGHLPASARAGGEAGYRRRKQAALHLAAMLHGNTRLSQFLERLECLQLEGGLALQDAFALYR